MLVRVPFPLHRGRTNPDRDELGEMIAYALWQTRRLLRPKGTGPDAYRRWARYVVEHLELCRVRWSRLPPVPPDSTPGR